MADHVTFTQGPPNKGDVNFAVPNAPSGTVQLRAPSDEALNFAVSPPVAIPGTLTMKQAGDDSTQPVSIAWGNISGTLSAQADLWGVLQGHFTDYANPHHVTKAQVGLGNVDNTSDYDKPVSSAQATINQSLQAQINTNSSQLAGKVNRAGDTMTGDLTAPNLTATAAVSGNTVSATTTVSAPQVNASTSMTTPKLTGNGVGPQAVLQPTASDASMALVKPSASYSSQIIGYNGVNSRWQMQLGNNTAEGGANAGSDFALSRFNDAGTLLGTPISVNRATGTVFIQGAAQPNLEVSTTTATDSAVISINKQVGVGSQSYLFGKRLGVNRWGVSLGNSNTETGSNNGSDFHIERWSDAGSNLGVAFGIRRSDGLATFQNNVSLDGNAARPSPSIYLNKTAGANVNSIQGTTAGTIRWNMQLGNGNTESGGNSGSHFALYRYSDAGALLDAPLVCQRDNGLTYVNGIYSGPTFGFRTNSYYPSSGNYYAWMTLANPNWNDIYLLTYHVPGVQAGLNISMTTVGTWDFRNNGNAYAPGTWVDTSDGRVKINRERITDARAKVSALSGWEYDRRDLKNMDGTLVHDAGLIGQDIDAVFSAAVTKGERKLGDGEVIADFHNVNYNAITALLVEDNNALAARIAALEEKIAALTAAQG